METIEYKGRILPDGHLSCPQKVKKQLDLFNGSPVKVIILSLKQGKVAKLMGTQDSIERTKGIQTYNDLEILNQNSEYLNQEAEDVLAYQVML